MTEEEYQQQKAEEYFTELESYNQILAEEEYERNCAWYYYLNQEEHES
jgi:hypothetical protein